MVCFVWYVLLGRLVLVGLVWFGRFGFVWYEDILKYEDLKNQDHLKNEDDLKNEDSLKNKDKLKNE